MATRGYSLRSSADSPAVQPLYMGRDAGAASFRDWKRAVDMKLSKKDDDLLHSTPSAKIPRALVTSHLFLTPPLHFP